MNWKRFFALLLVLALLPALFGNAFAAGPKARTLTDADYAPIDALWAELDAVEQDAQTGYDELVFHRTGTEEAP